MHFGGLFSLDENLSDAKYAVFDDMQGGLSFFTHTSSGWVANTNFMQRTNTKEKLIKGAVQAYTWPTVTHGKTEEQIQIG